MLFKGLGVQKDTRMPCWLNPWVPFLSQYGTDFKEHTSKADLKSSLKTKYLTSWLIIFVVLHLPPNSVYH